MSPYIKCALPLFIGIACFGQPSPQFVWQGEVDGTVTLHVRAGKLEVRVQEGAPVQHQQFHFYELLPETRQDARLEVIAGRGYAHIVSQPRLDNDYTLTISIEDRQPG